MSRLGDVYENRVTGERAVVLRGDEDGGDGRSFLVHLTVQPGGAVAGEHVHPAIDERFHVVAGTLHAKVGGAPRELGAGDEVTAAAGTPHDWWNAGTTPASVLVEITPADPRFETMIATVFGLANAGRTNAKGMPNPFQLALVGKEFADVIRFTSPPAVVQRVAFGLLGAAGRMRGYRGVYPEYLGPHGRAAPDPEVLAVAGLS